MKFFDKLKSKNPKLITPAELAPEEQKKQLASERLRSNKAFFYGFPLFVLAVCFISTFVFIVPTIRYYFESKDTLATLDANEATVKKSISNLNTANADTNLILTYTTILNRFLPETPKVGDIISVIQKTANDFNLENQGGSSTGTGGQTTVGNLTNNQDTLLESLDSGEIKFTPKNAGENVDAVLISLEFNLKGDKQKFFQFIEDIKKIQPLINVVSVEYSETPASRANESAQVNSVVKFEAYALAVDAFGVAKPIVPVKKDDAKLVRKMTAETFSWSKTDIIKALEQFTLPTSN